MKKSNQNSGVVLLSACLIAFVMVLAGPVHGQDNTNEPAERETEEIRDAGIDDEIETIVVRGFRQSLREALSLKENYVGVVDAIVAEDIGKFGQSNLSEAVQRISGVQITRDFAECRISYRPTCKAARPRLPRPQRHH